LAKCRLNFFFLRASRAFASSACRPRGTWSGRCRRRRTVGCELRRHMLRRSSAAMCSRPSAVSRAQDSHPEQLVASDGVTAVFEMREIEPDAVTRLEPAGPCSRGIWRRSTPRRRPDRACLRPAFGSQSARRSVAWHARSRAWPPGSRCQLPHQRRYVLGLDLAVGFEIGREPGDRSRSIDDAESGWTCRNA